MQKCGFVCMYAHSFVVFLLLVCCSVSTLCLTLCDPTDCSRPGSSVHGISQARIVEWVAISFSRGCSRPRDQNRISCISCIGRRVLPQVSRWGSPVFLVIFIYLTAWGLSCSLWNLHLWRVRSSSLTMVQTWAPCIGSSELSHWTTKEVPRTVFWREFLLLYGK